MHTNIPPDSEHKRPRDLFAELYVAGVLADAGWHIYFPKRDFGIDFIATKEVGKEILVRPIQVKGKYPRADKVDKANYGYSGILTQRHPEMVLAIPFFTSEASPSPPKFVAYMPASQIRESQNKPGRFSAMPCTFRSGLPQKRRDYQKFFDERGLKLMESAKFRYERPEAERKQEF